MAADSSDLITAEHLSKHNVKDDCWIVVHSKVWDVTEFLDLHPGGSSSKSYRYLVDMSDYIRTIALFVY